MKIKKPKDLIIIWLNLFYTNCLLAKFLDKLIFGNLHLFSALHVLER